MPWAIRLFLALRAFAERNALLLYLLFFLLAFLWALLAIFSPPVGAIL